jgi:hypothetical protein
MSLILSVIAIFISGITIGINLNNFFNNRYEK